MSNNATPIPELYRHIDRLVDDRDAALRRAEAAEAERRDAERRENAAYLEREQSARLRYRAEVALLRWDTQAIGAALGLPIGADVPGRAVGAIKSLRERAEKAEAEVARLRGLLEKRPEPYTPRVGDVVGFGGDNADNDNPRVVTSIDGDHAWVRYGKSGVRVRLKTSLMVFLRPATPAERAAAGLTPAEAAVATEKPVEPEAPAQPQVLPEHLAWMEADAAWACSSWSTDFDAFENKKRYDEAILAARALRAAVARRDGGQK